MPKTRVARMSGVGLEHVGSGIDHHPHQSVECAGMTDHEMREFMKEEQKEGMHPSLKGKRF